VLPTIQQGLVVINMQKHSEGVRDTCRFQVLYGIKGEMAYLLARIDEDMLYGHLLPLRTRERF